MKFEMCELLDFQRDCLKVLCPSLDLYTPEWVEHERTVQESETTMANICLVFYGDQISLRTGVSP